MEIIVPAAGLSTRFPNMKPKYLLYDYKHDMMLMNALRPFIQRGYTIHIGILKEHEEKYRVREQIKHECPDNINCVIIDKPTKGPADTVYQIIKSSNLKDGEIFIKDCDSYFDHEFTEGNYVCVSKISQHEVLKKLASKSFTISNENGIITDIVEKQVVSDTFCVGGYKFSSANTYRQSFEQLQTNREVFVSDVIGRCINDKLVFTEKVVTSYVDVGTAQDWFEHNNKPVIFCDIDGTIIKAQSRLDLEAGVPEVPLQNNVNRLLELQDKGAQFIFTSARENQYLSQTRDMLYRLGFKSFNLICGLQNSSRILINDFNESNPYPRAEAINLYRDSDNLSHYL
jgi:hypothetical protein